MWAFLNLTIAASYFVIPVIIGRVAARLTVDDWRVRVGILGFAVFIWSCGLGHVSMVAVHHAGAMQLVTHAITVGVSFATMLAFQ